MSSITIDFDFFYKKNAEKYGEEKFNRSIKMAMAEIETIAKSSDDSVNLFGLPPVIKIYRSERAIKIEIESGGDGDNAPIRMAMACMYLAGKYDALLEYGLI